MLDSLTGDKFISMATPSIVSNFNLSDELVAALVFKLLKCLVLGTLSPGGLSRLLSKQDLISAEGPDTLLTSTGDFLPTGLGLLVKDTLRHLLVSVIS